MGQEAANALGLLLLALVIIAAWLLLLQAFHGPNRVTEPVTYRLTHIAMR